MFPRDRSVREPIHRPTMGSNQQSQQKWLQKQQRLEPPSAKTYAAPTTKRCEPRQGRDSQQAAVLLYPALGERCCSVRTAVVERRPAPFVVPPHDQVFSKQLERSAESKMWNGTKRRCKCSYGESFRGLSESVGNGKTDGSMVVPISWYGDPSAKRAAILTTDMPHSRKMDGGAARLARAQSFACM